MKIRLNQKGFSIVELMVALLLGLFLVSGVTGMYVSSKQTFRMTDNLSRLQESLRFSLEFMSHDIRMASYLPCRTTINNTNALVSGSATWFLDYFDRGIHGYEGGVDAMPVASVVPGTDAIAILKASTFTSSLNFHNTGGNTLELNSSFTGQDFERGRIGVVCDPRQASIFQISDADSGLKTVSYGDNSNIVPGNSTTTIGTYGEDALVASYKPEIYYIRQSSQNANVNSLWRSYLVADGLITSTNTAQMDAEELLEGVESMQILYGVDVSAPNDQIVDRYVTANNVADWQNVIAVRLGLLMATGEEVTAQLDTNTYNVAGTLISDSSTISHPADKKLRYVANTTINLRNRTP
jgi:type IV pilus assembly protein PilW